MMEYQKFRRQKCYSECDADASRLQPLESTFSLQKCNVSNSDSSVSDNSDDDEEMQRLKREIEEKQKKLKQMKREKKTAQIAHMVNNRSIPTTTECSERPFTNTECNKQFNQVNNKTKLGNQNEIMLPFTETVDENIKTMVELEQKRGLVVTCCHSKFNLRTHGSSNHTDQDTTNITHELSSRPSAASDLDRMGGIWCQYGCEMLSFFDEKNEFYLNDLVDQIEKRLRLLPQLEFFTLILSTHGEEKEEHTLNGEAYFQHYFYSYDGQIQTQKLIEDIANIDLLANKVKMFFIQACRSRAYPNTDSQNIDVGVEVPISEEIMTELVNDPFRIHNTHVYVPNGDVKLQDTESRGKTQADAKGYMPDMDDDIPEEFLQSSLIDEFIPTTWIPHCDNCILMFASMAGKYAYSVVNSKYEGGWLIEALDDTLRKFDSNRQVDILDVLTEINNKVAQKDADYNKTVDGEIVKCVKAQSCFFHNITEELYLVRNEMWV